MLEPTVLCCSMPVFYFRRNIHNIACMQLLCRFFPLLIPATSACYKQDLTAFMMNMPIIDCLIWTPSPLFPKNTAFNGIQNCVLCIFSIFYFNLAYSSGSTGSNHSLDAPSAGTSTARCWNQLSFAAPCQCFTSGGMFTTSPAFSSCAGFPHS